MERIGEISSQLSQITLYDLKSYYNQAKNMVLNVSEMEAKVKEATNDDPWGASSTLMQEIAQGTFNFQQFNEIMPCIYSRFMEKEAKQWREIYKALQLMEYIIKHGSERVVDDARSHLSTIKMLRNFHYIDEKGKDQGVNVRNRSSEIAAMLVDLDKIRAERRKAKANRNKYVGTGNEGMSEGRYGGFGNDSMYGGGGSSDYYSNGGGGSSSAFRDDNGRRAYDDYDAGDDEDKSASRNSTSLRSPTSPASTSRRSGASSQPPRAELKDKAPEKQAPVEDLLGDWGDDTATTTTTTNQDKALPAVANNEIDDFDDFQTAPVSPPAVQPVYSQIAAPVAPIQATKAPKLFDMLNSNTSAAAAPPIMSRTPTLQSQQQPIQAQPARPNYFNNTMGNAGNNPISPVRSSFNSTPVTRPSPTPAHPPSKSSANFDDLWSLGLGTAGKPVPGAPISTGNNKSIKDLEKEKAQAGIWGASQGHQSQSSLGGFGGFSSATSGGGVSSTSGGDDLLL